VLFDVESAKVHPKMVAPEAQQEEFESRRLWTKLTAALQKRDMDLATAEKTQVEDRQRQIRTEKEKVKHVHPTQFFDCSKDDLWLFKHERYLMIEDCHV
jgi:oxysterol-binding protein-related protein 8